MKNINLVINGVKQNVTIERYFKIIDKSYVIYSIDSADADGNVKVFVAKVSDNLEVLPIDTQEEWDKVKNTIVGIVNDNKECNKLEVEDLNYQLLENLEITDAKALRLPVAVMPYLSANMPEFNNIKLEEQEQALEAKTESLKEMNADLTNLMNDVNQEFAKTENTLEEPKVEVVSNDIPSDSKKEDTLEATMEIIMPSNQNTESKDEKEEHKKKKGKFSLKHLFGKKDDEEKVEEANEVATEPVTALEENVETPSSEGIIHEAELPNPVSLEPIVVDEIPVVENEMPQEEINQDLEINAEISPEEENMIELPQSMSAGFEFFDVNADETKEVESKEETMKEPMEVLEVDDDLKYKALYEEEKKNNELLREKNAKLEELFKVYHEKLTQIRDIVR